MINHLSIKGLRGFSQGSDGVDGVFREGTIVFLEFVNLPLTGLLVDRKS